MGTKGEGSGAPSTGNTSESVEPKGELVKVLEPEKPQSVLVGIDKGFFNGKTHIGVVLEMTASGKISRLVIPDVMGVTTGAPVFIDSPIEIRGENLAAFLAAKGVALDEGVKALIKNASIGCDAFYYTRNIRTLKSEEDKKALLAEQPDPKPAKAPDSVDEGALLLIFQATVKDGLIKSLTNDEALGKLFDLHSVRVRVLRCPEPARGQLEAYARQLAGG